MSKKLKEFSCKKEKEKKEGKHNVPYYNLEKYLPPQKEIISIKHTKNIKMIYIYIDG